MRGRLGRMVFAPILVAIAACAGAAPTGPGTPPPGPDVSLTVFAAASLRDAFTELGDLWDPHRQMRFSFDASSALRAQIEQLAPADVFASADTKNPQALLDAALADAPLMPFAGNLLTIVVPKGSTTVASPTDLAKPGVRILAAGPDVPITKYADQVVANLAKQPGYPGGFADAVAANVVSREDNVKAVVAKIELGEGDAAIVYVTDANASDKVTTVPIPDAANVPATYAAAKLRHSGNPMFAAGFVEWLTGPVAQPVLRRYGFLPPP